MTVFSRLSKACTTFLCEPDGGGAAALLVDISQERTNLTNNTTWVSEASSARNAIDAPRSISIVVDMMSTDSRPMLELGNNTTYSYRIDLSGGLVRAREAGSTVISVAPLGLDGTARKVLIHWAQRPDGASVRSELTVYNFTTDQWAFATATHAATPAVVTDTLTLGSSFNGSSKYTGGLTAFHKVRIGRRFVSSTEAREDFVEETTPPTMTARRRTPIITGDSAELQIADAGCFAGPSYYLAMAATKAADSRGRSAIVNLVHRNPAIEYNTYSPENFILDAPGDGNFHLNMRYLWNGGTRRVNYAWCRIHVHAYNVGGPGDICPIKFRMYQLGKTLREDKPYGFIDIPISAYRRTADTVKTQVTEETGSPGVWVELGALRLDGAPVFGLGYTFNNDEGDSLEGETAFKILAVQIVPYFVPQNDGEDDGPNNKKKKGP